MDHHPTKHRERFALGCHTFSRAKAVATQASSPNGLLAEYVSAVVPTSKRTYGDKQQSLPSLQRYCRSVGLNRREIFQIRITKPLRIMAAGDLEFACRFPKERDLQWIRDSVHSLKTAETTQLCTEHVTAMSPALQSKWYNFDEASPSYQPLAANSDLIRLLTLLRAHLDRSLSSHNPSDVTPGSNAHQTQAQPHKTDEATSLYQPLAANNDHIRLLILHDADRTGVLRATMSKARLSSEPKFFALSYTWGDDSDMQELFVNGRALSIRNNLYQFLLRLRRPFASAMLWADAICINQRDDDERGKQVQMMCDIYRSAERVLVWLGREDVGIGNLMRSLRGDTIIKYNQHLAAGSQSLLVDWSAMKRLLERPYWTRAWIIQELVFARQATLFHGDASVEWQDMQSLVYLHSHGYKSIEHSMFNRLCLHRLQRRAAMNDFEREEHLKNAGFWLPNLFERYPHCSCSDIRDKVYSLLGLSAGYVSGRSLVKVDYTITPAELFFRTFNAYEGHRTVRFSLRLMEVLGLSWQDLVAANAEHHGRNCSDVEAAGFCADVSSGAQIKKVWPSNALSRVPPHRSFTTDFNERHEYVRRLNSYDDPETSGITNSDACVGDFVLVFASPRFSPLALIFRDDSETFNFIGFAFLTGDSGTALNTLPVKLRHSMMSQPEFFEGIKIRRSPSNTPYIELCIHRWAALCMCATDHDDYGFGVPCGYGGRVPMDLVLPCSPTDRRTPES